MQLDETQKTLAPRNRVSTCGIDVIVKLGQVGVIPS